MNVHLAGDEFVETRDHSDPETRGGVQVRDSTEKFLHVAPLRRPDRVWSTLRPGCQPASVLYTAVSKSRYPTTADASANGKICVAQ